MSLEELFGSILDVEPSSLTDATAQAALKAWDSMAHVNLIAALEETYGVQFSTQEIQQMTSIGAARGLLRRKGADV
ncbi:MAG TPA: acyl carrier protein [Herpetosiphonaceae bacterium]